LTSVPWDNRGTSSHSTRIAPSQGRAINAVNLPNARLLSWKTIRLVRFETGIRSDAEFARWMVEIEKVSWPNPRRAATASTTGVMTRTAASRLITAVAAAIVTKSVSSSRRWPVPAWATLQPAYSKIPARRHPSVIRSRAARKAAV